MEVFEENSAINMEKTSFFRKDLGNRSGYRYGPFVCINAMHVDYTRQCVSYLYCNGFESECSHLRSFTYEV